jgi:hypothetical protein
VNLSPEQFLAIGRTCGPVVAFRARAACATPTSPAVPDETNDTALPALQSPEADARANLIETLDEFERELWPVYQRRGFTFAEAWASYETHQVGLMVLGLAEALGYRVEEE